MTAQAPIRVVVVEDDTDLSESLAACLRFAGMSARATGSIAEMEAALAEEAADVIVLDVNLPGETGFAALDRLKLKHRAGIVMLTGRAAVHDRLQGLALGADHYLVKPFDMTELALVIRNLRARLGRGKASTGWSFDPARWLLTCPDGHALTLSAPECALMARLMASPGQPVHRAELLEVLRTGPAARETHLEVMVFRLRRRVEKSCRCGLPLQSVRGVGYVFTEGGCVGADCSPGDGHGSI